MRAHKLLREMWAGVENIMPTNGGNVIIKNFLKRKGSKESRLMQQEVGKGHIEMDFSSAYSREKAKPTCCPIMILFCLHKPCNHVVTG